MSEITQDIVKDTFTESPTGKGILIDTSLTLIHTAYDRVTAEEFTGEYVDEVWLFASSSYAKTNPDDPDAELIISFQGLRITQSIPSLAGVSMIIPGLLLFGAWTYDGDLNEWVWSDSTLSMTSSVADVVSVFGYVNRIIQPPLP